LFVERRWDEYGEPTSNLYTPNFNHPEVAAMRLLRGKAFRQKSHGGAPKVTTTCAEEHDLSTARADTSCIDGKRPAGSVITQTSEGTFEGTSDPTSGHVAVGRGGLKIDHNSPANSASRLCSNNGANTNPSLLDNAVGLYNEVAAAHELAPVLKLDRLRERKLRQALATHGLDGWKVAMAKIPRSPLLIGLKTDFRCDFDWLVDTEMRDNLLKVIEGKYVASRPPAASRPMRVEQLTATERQNKAALFRERLGNPASFDKSAWRREMSAYRDSHKWLVEWLGPTPGEPGCMVPVEVLRQFNIKPHLPKADTAASGTTPPSAGTVSAAG
jgi:hypothetical protein